MQKQFLAASIAAVGLFSVSALASDLPVKAPVYKAPIAAPAYNWSGFYAGVNFGAGTIAVIKGRGKVITFAVNLSGKGGSAYQYVYVIDYPLVTGGSWTNFYTTDGKTMGKMGGGTYTVSDGTPRKASSLKSSTEQP